MRGEAFNYNFYYHETLAFDVLFLVYHIGTSARFI